jgi:hypothetical protein
VVPSNLTEQERAALEAVGWTEDMPIPPSGVTGLLVQAAKEKKAEAGEAVILPAEAKVTAFQPPVTKELHELNPEERASILSAMHSLAKFQQAISQEKNDKGAAPMMHQALIAVPKAAASRQPEQAAVLEIEDDRPQRQPPAATPTQDAPTEGPRQAPSAAPAAKAEKEKEKEKYRTETGAEVQPSFCPHCLWDLSQPDVPEPPYADKMSFLHALLGARCWSKEYELFGGAVTVVFRTLTPREIDTVYKQAFSDRALGKLPTEVDFWEKINRYRLFLQLQQLRSNGLPDQGGFFHDLPDALSKSTNESGTGFWWKDDDGSYLLQQDATPLPRIEEYIIREVLKTEAVFRVVNNTCHQFNRLVAKMEAMAYHSDFWRPTRVQS